MSEAAVDTTREGSGRPTTMEGGRPNPENSQPISAVLSETPKQLPFEQRQLPPVVKSVQAGSQASFTSSATVTALFAAVEAQLLTFVQGMTDPGDNGTPPRLNQDSKGYHALLILTYASFFFSISATVSSLILTDEFGELDYRAAEEDLMNPEKPVMGCARSLDW
ncbi:hypothetical protein FRC09_001851 [Ceratobasidium sp. 395]|nr:hypothetical protein FRC09_001851 [Ceratobasidium sp. 395]